MTDIPTIAFIGLPLLTGCIGVGIGVYYSPTHWRARAEKYHRFCIEAAKECNRIEDDAKASISRVTDALAAKKDRLNRIVEAFADQRSGTARKAVKPALGDA